MYNNCIASAVADSSFLAYLYVLSHKWHRNDDDLNGFIIFIFFIVPVLFKSFSETFLDLKLFLMIFGYFTWPRIFPQCRNYLCTDKTRIFFFSTSPVASLLLICSHSGELFRKMLNVFF